MHMADALLSPAVGGVMCAVSAGALAGAAVKMKGGRQAEKKLPMMAVAGAFVFAAQMINFTIPGTGCQRTHWRRRAAVGTAGRACGPF